MVNIALFTFVHGAGIYANKFCDYSHYLFIMLYEIVQTGGCWSYTVSKRISGLRLRPMI